jgi:predicted transcriptional regulator
MTKINFTFVPFPVSLEKYFLDSTDTEKSLIYFFLKAFHWNNFAKCSGEFTIGDIAKEINKNRRVTSEALFELEKSGLIKTKKQHRSILIGFNKTYLKESPNTDITDNTDNLMLQKVTSENVMLQKVTSEPDLMLQKVTSEAPLMLQKVTSDTPETPDFTTISELANNIKYNNKNIYNKNNNIIDLDLCSENEIQNQSDNEAPEPNNFVTAPAVAVVFDINKIKKDSLSLLVNQGIDKEKAIDILRTLKSQGKDYPEILEFVQAQINYLPNRVKKDTNNPIGLLISALIHGWAMNTPEAKNTHQNGGLIEPEEINEFMALKKKLYRNFTSAKVPGFWIPSITADFKKDDEIIPGICNKINAVANGLITEDEPALIKMLELCRISDNQDALTDFFPRYFRDYKNQLAGLPTIRNITDDNIGLFLNLLFQKERISA